MTRIGVVPGTGDAHGTAERYRVLHERTGPRSGRDVRVTTARYVVVAAGTWGTQHLLHEMKDVGELPRISERLGHLTRTNSEALLGATTLSVPEGADLSRGVAITSSFHPDEVTHVENCRYGKGSNAMALLAGVRVPPDTGRSRLAQALVELARHPRDLRAVGVNAYRWSERTVIGLVMQTRDNSLRTSRRKGLLGRHRLTSEQGHGEPNPTYIEVGHTAMQALAVRLEEETGTRAVAGGSWGEVLDTPMTAHFIGGAPIGSTPERGVLDPYHRLWGHPGISVVDGAAVSANLGVNPSLTITAQAERAMSLWPNRGDADPRPAQDQPYAVLSPVPARRPAVPAGFPVRVDLGMPSAGPPSPRPVSVGRATMGG